MAVNWTSQQLEAIEAKGSNILVAAAAGSGKTAVLVERVIRMICDEENPVSVDKLLILTFTEAAASEMRRKIAYAIEKKLFENPDNKWLKEQCIRVGSACISTIHAFCKRILSNNVHLSDLPSDFSLIDDTENKLLQEAALDSVLESYYCRIDKKHGFRELVLGFGGIKGDNSLRELIIELHNFSRSLAYPKKWLHDVYKNGYSNISKGASIKDSVWSALLADKLYQSALIICEGLNIIWNIVEKEVPSDHKYFTYYYDMKASFCDKFSALSKNDTDGLIELITSFEIKTAPRKTGLDEQTVERINNIKKSIVKAEIEKTAEFLAIYNEDNISRLSKCAPVIKCLCSIVRQTERVHQRLKREKSAIDFSDLEHGLLHLLINENGVEKPLCQKLREHYHEILLDEFQDTNLLQFEIFSKLSKKSGNLFMVGDVKQCIYKFRNADPSIFMRLYKEYGAGNGGRLIQLFSNFRSRAEVIEGVNYVFSSVMSERLGGIDYTKDEYLICGAEYTEGDDYTTEIILTDTEAIKLDNDTLEDFEKSELEAQSIANRIQKLVCIDKLSVTDKESGEMRPVTYSDITVLCRNAKDCRTVDEALSELGISSISDTGNQYLDSVEVSTVLSFLQIIDNPLQDIPLIAVMRSHMFRFTADELAKIRICANGRFYTALCKSAENNNKSRFFLDTLLKLRECSKYMGTDELVWKICNDLHYFSIVGALPNGNIRRANLKLLLNRCSDFEQGHLTGLFNFIKYIENLKASGKDLSPIKDMGSDIQAVKIMTMHKSKGLEFPVVILFGTSKKFYLKDVQRNIIWDEKLGIGLDYVDTRQRVRFKSPSRKMLEDEMLASLKSEEMRLLYVAMTRAKEKLIISASISSKDNKWKDAEFDENHHLYPSMSDKIMSQRDWVLSSLMNSKDADTLRQMAERYDILPRIDITANFNIYSADSAPIYSGMANIEPDKISVKSFSDDISERLSYTYPLSELNNLPIKLSVSELKRRKMADEDYSTPLININTELSPLTNRSSSAEKGTVTHFVLQQLDITNTSSIAEISGQVEGMVSNGTISKEQSELVDINSIHCFFESPLGKRLKASNRYEREFDFYMLVPPSEVSPQIEDRIGDDVLLQGIADCFFFEDDGVVLLDYKTDRVSSANAHERAKIYKLQTDYYARGIEAILNIPVKEKYIYFLACGEAIKM